MKKYLFLVCIALALIVLALASFVLLSEGDGTGVVQIQEQLPQEVSVVASETDQRENLETTMTPEEELECLILDDFTGESDLRWYTVNDGVMGGLSDGSASIENDTLIHSGTIVTRGGGFSYVGAQLPSDTLVGYQQLQVRLNTFGRQYNVNFADSRAWRVTHQAPIPVGEGDDWQEVLIDFSDTVPTVFSREVNSAPFDAGAVEELSFILSDGVDGPFRTEIDWVKICR